MFTSLSRTTASGGGASGSNALAVIFSRCRLVLQGRDFNALPLIEANIRFVWHSLSGTAIRNKDTKPTLIEMNKHIFC